MATLVKYINKFFDWKKPERAQFDSVVKISKEDLKVIKKAQKTPATQEAIDNYHRVKHLL